MKLRRSHSLRWIIIGSIALAALFAGTLVVNMLLLRQADQFTAVQQNAAAITKTPVITSLPLSGILSPQWFNQLQNYDIEFANQLSGIANRLGVPLPPTQVTVSDTALGNRALIQWATPLGQQYDGVEIYRDTTEAMAQAKSVTTNVLTSTGYYFDDTIDNDQVYYYQLRSYRSGNEGLVYSNWSDVISVIPTDQTPPAPPQLVSVQSMIADEANPKATAGLIITWLSSTSSSDVAAYRIYRSTESGRLGQQLDQVAADVTAARDTDVQPGVTYYYTVTALDAAQNESATTVLAGSAGHNNPFISPAETSTTNTNSTNGN